MNIREMNPYPSIWVFVTVAVCVTAITLMAASYQLIQGFFQQILYWLRRVPYHVYWFKLHLRLFIKDSLRQGKKKSSASVP
jgi:hypothetical protein